MSETRKAIIISTGMDNLPLLQKLAETPPAVGAMLDRVKGLYAKFSEEKAAIEAKENAASLARLKQNLEQKAAATKEFFENQAQQAEIARGSGAYGSMPASRRGGRGGGSAGMIAGQVAADIADGLPLKKVAEGAGITTGIWHLSNWVNELVHGKNPFAGFSRIPHAIERILGGLARFGRFLSVAGIATAAAYEGGKKVSGLIGLQSDEAHEAQSEHSMSTSGAGLAVGLQQAIDDAVRSGAISKSDAERFNGMLGDNPSIDRIRAIQRELISANDAVSSKAAANAAQSEHDRSAAADYAVRQASAKASAEKSATDQQIIQAKLNEKYNDLAGQGKKIRTEWNREDSSIPSLENLAGRGFTEQLDKDYGPQKFDRRGRLIAGKYSLSAGDGVFGKAARESLLAGKQMEYDLTYGNGSYVTGPDGIGHFTGQAELDRQNKMRADNLLGAAGLDTPAQKMEAMKTELIKISGDIATVASAIRNGAMNSIIDSQ